MQVLTPARHPRLMSPDMAISRLGSLATGQESLLEALVLEASEAIADALGFPPWRQTYRASLPSVSGEARLSLGMAPVEPGTVSISYSDEVLDAESYQLDSAAGILYRAGGWPDTSGLTSPLGLTSEPGSELPIVTAEFVGGWVMPEDLRAWEAGATYELGDFVKPPWPAIYLHEVTVAGVAGGSAPTWGVEVGEEVESGAVTMVARAAKELPRPITAACLDELRSNLFSGRRDPDMASRSVPGLAITWRNPGGSSGSSSSSVSTQAFARLQPYIYYGSAA